MLAHQKAIVGAIHYDVPRQHIFVEPYDGAVPLEFYRIDEITQARARAGDAKG